MGEVTAARRVSQGRSRESAIPIANLAAIKAGQHNLKALTGNIVGLQRAGAILEWLVVYLRA